MISPHTTSIVFPVQPTQVAQVLPFAQLLQRRGSGRLWLGQSLGVETHHVFAALAGAGIRIPFGTSVALAGLRHPYDAAVQARSVAQLSGLPFVAGIGPGGEAFQRMVRPAPMPKPVTVSSQYVTTMRELIESRGGADTDGLEHSTHGALPVMNAPPVELGLGVLRPAMARAAGRVADVAITWLTPPRFIEEALVPALEQGAAQAERPVPRVATVVHVAVQRPGRDIEAIAHSAAYAHLGSPHYTDMLRQAGVPADPADTKGGAALLVSSRTFVSGTPAEIADGLDRYRAAGVGEVILNVCGVYTALGMGAAMTDMQQILAAVDGRHA
ncbi:MULTISPECIES: LLM class flavin-dependent oxidoreductase [unclassified Streptomyces]|uniref:LLM class flavin-dependent oxidoreductase n=1 Tax=unclassified Streptomyces TaxID=2593676 RepID=UPI002E31E5FD|nr:MULTISPECIES: LLM class flavin-dependent oxidoreductase [unclassified Streptomyces]WUC69149.1 LLM class flavin-dependent oxidoreductase [Streptomyces sp. NBC_00539]